MSGSDLGVPYGKKRMIWIGKQNNLLPVYNDEGLPDVGNAGPATLIQMSPLQTLKHDAFVPS